MPPRVASSGFEFIEFAASHEEAEEFGRFFSALGFAPTARHRSKDVVRWQQGAINLVVNSEPEGLAHSFDMVHGGSVCALGIAVADQAGALARAEALDIPRFAPRWGRTNGKSPRSARWAAACSIWWMRPAGHRCGPTNFPVPLPGVPSADLIRIDHVAQAMHYEEFLSWLLYYTALLEVEKTPQLEITDPMGLVYSQAVENADQEPALHAQRFAGGAIADLALHPELFRRGRAARRLLSRRCVCGRKARANGGIADAGNRAELL